MNDDYYNTLELENYVDIRNDLIEAIEKREIELKSYKLSLVLQEKKIKDFAKSIGHSDGTYEEFSSEITDGEYGE